MIMIKHHHILEFPILNPLALCWNCLGFFVDKDFNISRLCSSFWNHNLFTKNRVVKLKKGPTIKIKSSGTSQLRSVKNRGLCLHYINTTLWKTFFYGGLTLASEDNVCFIAWTFFLIYVCICIWKKLPCLDLQLWHTHTHIIWAMYHKSLPWI